VSRPCFPWTTSGRTSSSSTRCSIMSGNYTAWQTCFNSSQPA
jgi:hypothetical protein